MRLRFEGWFGPTVLETQDPPSWPWPSCDHDVDELIRDLEWRATRYAMAGDIRAHDVIIEALRSVSDTLHVSVATSCDCREQFADEIADFDNHRKDER